MGTLLGLVWIAFTAVGQPSPSAEQCKKNFKMAADICLEPEQSLNPGNYDLNSFSGRASLANDNYTLNALATQKCSLALNNCMHWCSQAANQDQTSADAHRNCSSGAIREAYQARTLSLESQKQIAEAHQKTAKKVAAREPGSLSVAGQLDSPPINEYNRNGTARAQQDKFNPNTLPGKMGDDQRAMERGQESPRSGFQIFRGLKVAF